MADDLRDRGVRDRSRVNVHKDYEVRYWSRKQGMTAEQLVQAVRTAGVLAEAVVRELGRSQP